MSDAELFDFNAALMMAYDDEHAHANLKEYGDAFRFQLVAALHLDSWADGLEEDASSMTQVHGIPREETRGWINAIREIAANMRQGYYLPGGMHYEQVVRAREVD